MTIDIHPITTQTLQEFYDAFPHDKTFLQTPAYGNFRNSLGEENFRWGFFVSVEGRQKLIGVAQFQKIEARRGHHLHCPHGPVFLEKYTSEGIASFLEKYPKKGREEKCDFVRVSPLIQEDNTLPFKKAKFRSAPVHLVNPERTWVLDITQSEEDILKNMKKSTRYEVRRIEKAGIEVEMGNDKEDLERFWALHLETVKRHGFVPFSKDSTEKELYAFGENAQIFSAYTGQDDFYSSSVILYDKHAGYYHQGASLPHKLPFSYATLWAAILHAKRQGCTEFNFWGVCEETDKTHPWYGLSKFKRGFGGEERSYLHAQDYPLTPKYWINWVVEKYRRWKRGY